MGSRPRSVPNPAGSARTTAAPTLSPAHAQAFDRLVRGWVHMGEDAFDWAVLGVDSEAATPGVDRFLQTGDEIWTDVRRRAAELRIPTTGATALDFGCGPGRVSQAMSSGFDQVQGIDVAPGMIDLARRIDRTAGKCRFELWKRADLAGIPDSRFDLVFSAFVFQHLPAWLTRRYVSELLRVTRPGGGVVLQHHARPTTPLVGRLPPELVSLGSEWAGRLGVGPRSRRRWEDHWMSPSKFAAFLQSAGAELQAADRAPRPEGRMVSYWYYARRP